MQKHQTKQSSGQAQYILAQQKHEKNNSYFTIYSHGQFTDILGD